MSEQDFVNDDTSNVTMDDTSVSDTDTNDNTDDSAYDSNDVEVLKQRLLEKENANKKLFARAKEAEGYKLVNGEWIKKPKPTSTAKSNDTKSKDEYDLEDVAVLVSKVSNKEDRDFVKKSAKLLDLTLEETLNDSVVQGKLKEREEFRKSSEVANTSSSRRTSQRVSNETILENAQKGKLPATEEEISKLAKATVESFKKK